MANPRFPYASRKIANPDLKNSAGPDVQSGTPTGSLGSNQNGPRQWSTSRSKKALAQETPAAASIKDSPITLFGAVKNVAASVRPVRRGSPYEP